MADPFLLAHLVGPRIFDLSGKLNPISIRDQMVRGKMLIDRAFDENLIGPDESLLVIGAGACGATAAVRAAERETQTLLIDKNPYVDGVSESFRLQHQCKTRWIDPVQYDWPLDHWDQERFPWTGAKTAFPWKSGPSREVAEKWRIELNQYANMFRDKLEIQYDTRPGKINSYNNNTHRIQVELITSRKERSIVDVSMIVVCSGAGLEKVFIHSGTDDPPQGVYRGFRFWDDDPLEQEGSGLGKGNDDVLISGSGDGALQDFLRVATRKSSAKEIYQDCFGSSESTRATIERTILCAEMRARSALHWGTGGRYDHDIHQELERVHRKMVDLALKDSSVVKNLDSILDRRPKSLKLIHRCSHLMCNYALNRFLVLLISERLSQEIGNRVIESETAVAGVLNSHPPDSCGDPWICLGKNHEITIRNHLFCWAGEGVERSTRLNANVVVIRHGIEATDIPWIDLTPLSNPRQILPYYLI